MIKYPDSLDFLLSVEKTSDDKTNVNWINESLALGRTHAYANARGNLIASGDSLGSDYLERNKPVLIERLVLASERLAMLLNAIAAGEQPQDIPTDQSMMNRVARIPTLRVNGKTSANHRTAMAKPMAR